MWTSSEVFRILATSHASMMAAILLKTHRRDPSALASVAFLLTVACHLVFPLLLSRHASPTVLHVVLLGACAVPWTFWVLTRFHFEDDFRLRALHWSMLFGLVVVGYLTWLGVVERRVSTPLFDESQSAFWILLPRLLALAMVANALLTVYAGARSDLLVARLKLRYSVLIVSGSYVLIELLGEVLLRGSQAQAIAERAHALAVYVLVAGISVVALLVGPDVLRPARGQAPGPVLDPQLAERLQRLIETDQVFREEGLTIARLAATLGVQEYKLRQLVNSEQGFRNFNAFLNHYRIREARKALGDPAKRHLGIAQIAYEVGYGSLGPFNKAFRELTGLTPSEFRAARLPSAAPEERAGLPSPPPRPPRAP